MLLRKTLQFGAATGVPALINFAALSLYTHLLAPVQYGQVALVLACVTVANALLFQWLRSATRRFVVAWSDRRPVFLATVARAYLVLAAATLAGAVIVSFVVRDHTLVSLVGLGALILLGQSWYELNLDLVLMEHRADQYGALALTRSIVSLVIGVGLAWSGAGAIGPLVGMAAGYVLPGVWSYVTAWRGGSGLRAATTLMNELVGYGVPLSASFALQFVLDSSDRLLIGVLAGTASVGSYAVSYDFAQQALFLLLVAVNLAAYPLIVRALEQGGAGATRRSLHQQGVLLVAVGLPAAVALGVLAGPLAQLIFGDTYRPAATQLLPVISLGVLLGGFKAFYADLAFQLAHRTGWLVRIALPSAALNIGLNLLWIPRLGALGAAWATVAAFAFGLALSIAFGRRFFSLVWPWRDWAAITVATACFGLALWPLRNAAGFVELATGTVAAGLVYLALILLLDAGGARTALRHLARARKRVTQ